MRNSIFALACAILSSACAAGEFGEYLRVGEKSIPFFASLDEAALPALEGVAGNSRTLDVERVRQAVFDLLVVTKDSHGVVNVASTSTAFAIRIGDEILLAGTHHAFENAVAPLSKFAVLAKGSDGNWLHLESFRGVCKKTDLVLGKPSRVPASSIGIAPSTPGSLDVLYACGRIGKFSGMFRKGEVMKTEESSFLASLPAGQGSSGSPVLDKHGQLVGMITEVIPVLRESGLYSGDHFAECMITKCRSFQPSSIRKEDKR